MNEKPILFSTPMVRAIHDDLKTQTRRVIRLEFLPGYNPEWTGYKPVFEYGLFFLAGSRGEPATKKVKPRYQPGDILWVRETWRYVDFMRQENGDWSANVKYIADGSIGQRIFDLERGDDGRMCWKPSIHMPRKAARLFLEVTDVRVERVQEITADDCIKEGIVVEWSDDLPRPSYTSLAYAEMRVKPAFRKAYAQLWDTLNAKRGFGWTTNPWVWVYEFKRLEAKP